ncbi:hypothetical protein [Halorubrum coriense]|uniref:hypothetical protein n=1 Tax=Halorubrum coriense TaxID=64713 RepID=UPI001268B07C|nr:hypothetical protein [Halorubrum coriense]
MSSTDGDDKPWPYTRLTAALMFSILLLVPIVLAGLPGLNRNAVTGLLTREEVILLFFISTPIVFIAFTAYRVAQFYGIMGDNESP